MYKILPLHPFQKTQVFRAIQFSLKNDQQNWCPESYHCPLLFAQFTLPQTVWDLVHFSRSLKTLKKCPCGDNCVHVAWKERVRKVVLVNALAALVINEGHTIQLEPRIVVREQTATKEDELGKLCSSIRCAAGTYEHEQRAWIQPIVAWSSQEKKLLSLCLSLPSFLVVFYFSSIFGTLIERPATIATHTAIRCSRSFAHSHLHHWLSLCLLPVASSAFSNFRDTVAHSRLNHLSFTQCVWSLKREASYPNVAFRAWYKASTSLLVRTMAWTSCRYCADATTVGSISEPANRPNLSEEWKDNYSKMIDYCLRMTHGPMSGIVPCYAYAAWHTAM